MPTPHVHARLHRWKRFAAARCALTLYAMLAVAGACAPAGPDIRLERAVLVQPAANAPAVLYFTLRNRGSAPDYLVGVAVTGAEMVTMHETMQQGMDMSMSMQMVPTASIPVPARSTVQFRPGGLHVQVEKLTRPLVPGDSSRIALQFARGAVSGFARVVRYEDLDKALEPPSL
jgi:copper(I)-binding protein